VAGRGTGSFGRTPRRHEDCRWRSAASRAHQGTRARSGRSALLGSVVAAGGSSQDAALPKRRPTRRSSRGRVGGLAESTKVARDALRLSDHRQQAHTSIASRAGEHVKAEGSAQELVARRGADHRRRRTARRRSHRAGAAARERAAITHHRAGRSRGCLGMIRRPRL
jgi:hypothetical protein